MTTELPLLFAARSNAALAAFDERLLGFLSEHHNITREQITCKRRFANWAYVRFLRYYFLREVTGATFQMIADQAGGVDNTAVQHGCKSVRETIRFDPAFAKNIELWMRLLTQIWKEMKGCD